MTSPVQNKQQISVSLNIDTRGDINPKLDALAENLRYFHSLHGKMLTLELDSGWSNSVFVPAVPLSAVVTHILAASDAAILPHYTAPPRGRPWAPRIAAGVKQLKQHQQSLAVSALQSAGPRIITTRREALVRYLRHHRIFERIPSETALSSIFKL